MNSKFPKRLIEVDLPIKRISAHARREKSIRHGHISTLHIWWARRPLAACRAVICASLWPDPADPLCPAAFRAAAAEQMITFAAAALADAGIAGICDGESWKRYGELAQRTTPLDLTTLPIPRRNGDPPPAKLADLELLRTLLLDFIADLRPGRPPRKKSSFPPPGRLRKPRMKAWAACRARGPWWWIRLPAAEPSHWRHCAWARMRLPVTLIRWRCC